jgi:hypothetical protein
MSPIGANRTCGEVRCIVADGGGVTIAIGRLHPGPPGLQHPRFKNDVLAKNPSLVIWQVGSNAAWKNYFLDDVQAAIFRGVDHLRKCKADVILMDLQYAPALLDEKQANPPPSQMLDLIATAAGKLNVGLFRRFEIMKYWHTVGQVSFEQIISNFDANWLHQNDWSYDCIAKASSVAR